MKRCSVFVSLATTALAVSAQAPESAGVAARPWTDQASLSIVSLSGNAEGRTFGFANDYKYSWKQSSLAFNTGAVRVSTTTIDYSAAGTGTEPGQYAVTETRTTATTAESVFANARFDHQFAEAFFWFASLGWDRNRPAGIDSRSAGNGGLGYWWARTGPAKLRTDLGLGYTRVRPVFEAPGFQDSYGTWNATVDYTQKAGAAGLVSSVLQVTDSMKDGKAWLAVWKNAFTTNLGQRLALKVGVDLTYNHAPAFQGVPILLTGATPPVVLGSAPVPLKKLDTVFTTSLVISL